MFSQVEANIILNNVFESTVRDYFTPNIKAEVILDMLMTNLVGDIVQFYVGEKETKVCKDDVIRLVTKEMALVKSVNNNNLKGKKVDYVLANNSSVYLVELKTTSGSFDIDQCNFYRYFLGLDKPWNIMLKILLKIVNKTCGLKRVQLDNIESITYEDLKYFLDERLQTYKNQKVNISGISYTEKVKQYLKINNCESSWKYLYTIGNILDFFKEDSGSVNLIRENVKLIYITPKGQGLEKIDIAKEKSITFLEIMEDKEKIYAILSQEKKPLFNYFCKLVSQCLV